MFNKIDKMSIAPKRFKISQNPENFPSSGALLFDSLQGKDISPGLYKKKMFALNFERLFKLDSDQL